jgi:microcystin-dependent protein
MHSAKFLIVAVILIVTCHQAGAQSKDTNDQETKLQPTYEGDWIVDGQILGIGMVPPGGIVMFFGDAGRAFDENGTGITGTPYEGWQLCNGNNNSPDLQDKFVAASGSKYAIGNQGGADSVTLSVGQAPAHAHTGGTAAAGLHQHWIEGIDAKGLAKRRRTIPGQTTVDMGYGGGSNADPNGVRWRGHVNTDTVGNHAHGFSTNAIGGNQAHENRPKFFVLAFILKLPTSAGN